MTEGRAILICCFAAFCLIAGSWSLGRLIHPPSPENAALTPLFELGDCFLEKPEYNEWSQTAYRIIRVGEHSYRVAKIDDSMYCEESIRSETYCKTVQFKHQARYQKTSCNRE